MSILIDTDVAIHWRDKHPDVEARLRLLQAPPFLSFFSRVELLNGVYKEPSLAALRAGRLRRLLNQSATLPIGAATLAAYETIIATTGYSRRKVNDRLIAATALEHGLTLVTMNAADFRDVPRLVVEDWVSD